MKLMRARVRHGTDEEGLPAEVLPDPADEAPQEPTGRVRRVTPPGIVLLVAAGGVFTAFVDATIVNTIFPEIQRDFQGSSIGALSWIFNAYSIVAAAFLIPAGRIADVIGRRRVFRLGIAIFTLGSVLCAAAPSLNLLIVARIIQALGGALLIPTSLALVLDAYPATSRSHGIALWGAAAALASGVGPAVGGSLVALSGWRMAFLVNLPLGIAIFVATGRTIVESRSPGKRVVPDVLGSGLLAISLAALILGIVKANDWGIGSAGVIVAAVIAVVTLVAFVRRTRVHRAPLIDLKLLRIRAFAVSNVLTVLTGVAFYAYLLCNVLFLTTIWHYSILDAGLSLTPAPFIAAAVSGLFAKLTTRFGYRTTLFPGALVWGGGVLWMITQVGSQPAFVSQWLPGMAILGIGAGAVFPQLGSAAQAAAPNAPFATTTALNSVARQLGAALGIALLVAIVGTPGPTEVLGAFHHGWTMSAVIFAVVAVGGLALGGLQSNSDEPVLRERASLVRALKPLTVTAGAGAVGRLSAFFAEAAAPRVETVADVLSRTDFFGAMPASLVATIADRSKPATVTTGQTVYAEGDEARMIYVVRSGRVQVLRKGDAAGVDLGRGTVLGAVTAFARSTHGESVIALRDTELIVVDRDTITQLAGGRPDLSMLMVKAANQRLERAPRAPIRPEAPAIIAVVPVHESIRIRDLTSQLSDACGRLGSAGLLNGGERVVRDGESVSDVFGPLLAGSERDVDRTLLVAKADVNDPWTDFCLRHADRVLVVASSEVTDVPEGIAALRGSDLVVLGEGSVAAALLAALDPRATHRVSKAAGSVDRLARRLAGRSIGLVLSGGGARAFAHIGVLSELLAAGIEIDRVGGTSMGAYIGALLASGMSMQEVDACCYDNWVRSNPISDYTVPRAGFVRGRTMEAMLKEVFGERQIEDLDRSFYCVSSDLRAQVAVVHRNGPVWSGVIASMCLPILAAPRVVGRQLLVDGSLMDNLPVETMAAAGEGPVLAIDIKQQTERSPAPGKDNGAAARVSSRPPGLMDTLNRVLWLASANTSAQAALYADRLIEVRVGAVGLTEFHQIDTAVQAGADAAREALDEHGADLGLINGNAPQMTETREHA